MKIVPTILAMTIFQFAYPQNDCDESFLMYAESTNYKPLPFSNRRLYLKPNTKEYFGAGPVVCGESCQLVITKAFYDKANCEMTMEGYYFYGTSLSGRSQFFDYSIFLAEPVKKGADSYLRNIRTVLEVPARKYDNGNISSPYGDGFFRIRFAFSVSDRLYFDAGQHVYLTEYSVGCLLQRQEYKEPLNVR